MNAIVERCVDYYLSRPESSVSARQLSINETIFFWGDMLASSVKTPVSSYKYNRKLCKYLRIFFSQLNAHGLSITSFYANLMMHCLILSDRAEKLWYTFFLKHVRKLQILRECIHALILSLSKSRNTEN